MDPVERAFREQESQEQALEEQRKREQKRMEKRLDSLKAVLATEEGRAFLWMLMEDCNIFAPVFDTDHAVMARREGGRQVGLRIMAEASVHFPDLYTRMATENMNLNQGDQ